MNFQDQMDQRGAMLLRSHAFHICWKSLGHLQANERATGCPWGCWGC